MFSLFKAQFKGAYIVWTSRNPHTDKYEYEKSINRLRSLGSGKLSEAASSNKKLLTFGKWLLSEIALYSKVLDYFLSKSLFIQNMNLKGYESVLFGLKCVG